VVDLELVVDAGECYVDALRVAGVDEGDAAAGNGFLLAARDLLQGLVGCGEGVGGDGQVVGFRGAGFDAGRGRLRLRRVGAPLPRLVQAIRGHPDRLARRHG